MKSLSLIAVLGFLVMASPALAAAGAPASVTNLVDPFVTQQEHLVDACALAIAEDRTTCQFTVIASEGCEPAGIEWMQAFGPQLFGSDAFVASCLGRAPKAHGPPG